MTELVEVSTEYGVAKRKSVKRGFQNLHYRDAMCALVQKWEAENQIEASSNPYEGFKNIAIKAGVCTEEEFKAIYEDKLARKAKVVEVKSLKNVIAEEFSSGKNEEEIISELKNQGYEEIELSPYFKSLQKTPEQVLQEAVADGSMTKEQLKALLKEI